MKTVEVDFQHYQYTFEDADLIRYGSPHFSDKEIGESLETKVLADATRRFAHTLRFDPRQILCANEAYPEAAISDPLADLDIWDEWRSGRRVFPYPGQFSRLGITAQHAKTESPASIGVIGEIFAGLFAQSYIAPHVIVRVIRRWPDFIFYSGNGIYSFVESKAFTDLSPSYGSELRCRVTNKLIRELLVDASRQLNSDAFLKVWGAFTSVREIQPDLRMQVSFLELEPPGNRRSSQTSRVLPQAVVEGVARRAIARAAISLSSDDLEAFKGAKSNTQARRRQTGRANIEQVLASEAQREAEMILAHSSDELAVTTSMKQLHEEIQHQLRDATLPASQQGSRFFSLKESGSVDILQPLRHAGAETLYAAPLREGHNDWNPSWEVANQPFGQVNTTLLWRCGGMVFALTEADLGDLRIS